MFSGFMVDTWIAAIVVAVVAGLVGFFVVLRGSAFVAHALPNGSFAGAAGAALVGVSTLLGLAVFAVLGALGIAGLGRRGPPPPPAAPRRAAAAGTGRRVRSRIRRPARSSGRARRD
jgi:zinc/manganese transport system permease protein